jgi:hypothetical protein
MRLRSDGDSHRVRHWTDAGAGVITRLGALAAAATARIDGGDGSRLGLPARTARKLMVPTFITWKVVEHAFIVHCHRPRRVVALS